MGDVEGVNEAELDGDCEVVEVFVVAELVLLELLVDIVVAKTKEMFS